MTNAEKRIAEKNGTLDKLYCQKVHELIRKVYNQDDVEAILNNYIAEPENAKYIEEFKTLQEYRAQCKSKARAEIYEN